MKAQNFKLKFKIWYNKDTFFIRPSYSHTTEFWSVYLMLRREKYYKKKHPTLFAEEMVEIWLVKLLRRRDVEE